MPFLVKPDEERVSKKTRVKEKLIKEIEEKKKSLSEEDWKKLRKIKGIILFSISGWSDAGGHISLWDGKNIIYVGDEDNYNNPISQKYYFHMTKYFEIKGKKDKIVQTDSIKLWELK
ncbi:T6SS effector amidase Tae4 family protein [Capnocytophaga cynodegmi]|uniref:T6SS effector amidase Tae4 family protein n=1 Tax=Capnocytophaga cynodegmi TaxID=28189 RepID=UPI00385FD166